MTSLIETSIKSKEKIRYAPVRHHRSRAVRRFKFHSCQSNTGENTHERQKVTPVLLVREIEPVIPFWIDRLGFAKTIEVPDGSKLGFVTFQKGATEVMYQTYASVEKDAPPSMSAGARKGPTYLYIEVDNFDAVLASMKDVKIVMPVRTAFYGMKEFAVQDPGGNFITFAQPVSAPQH